MNILKIFSVVVGIHVFALVLIFANPGCSSPNKPAPSPSETVTQNSGSPSVVSRAAEDANPVVIAGGDSPVSSVPSTFDPNAAAQPAIRFSPTRPGTPAAASLETAPVGDVLPATTYSVVKGDSLWTIAKKNHLSVAELAAANNIRANAPVRIGQKLIIPSQSITAPSNALEQPGAKPAEATVQATPRASKESVKHVVRAGETLGAIARKYQVSVGEIATANSISDPAKIRQGTELVIPGWQAPKSRSATTQAAPAPTPAQPIATPEPTPAPSSAPSLVIPAPEEGPQPASEEPPVIRVDERP
jgi:LysM repeat protein